MKLRSSRIINEFVLLPGSQLLHSTQDNHSNVERTGCNRFKSPCRYACYALKVLNMKPKHTEIEFQCQIETVLSLSLFCLQDCLYIFPFRF